VPGREALSEAGKYFFFEKKKQKTFVNLITQKIRTARNRNE